MSRRCGPQWLGEVLSGCHVGVLGVAMGATPSRAADAPMVDTLQLWRPDEASPVCMHCGALFTMLRRRHHCRGCGELLCGACTRARVVLPDGCPYSVMPTTSTTASVTPRRGSSGATPSGSPHRTPGGLLTRRTVRACSRCGSVGRTAPLHLSPLFAFGSGNDAQTDSPCRDVADDATVAGSDEDDVDSAGSPEPRLHDATTMWQTVRRHAASSSVSSGAHTVHFTGMPRSSGGRRVVLRWLSQAVTDADGVVPLAFCDCCGRFERGCSCTAAEREASRGDSTGIGDTQKPTAAPVQAATERVCDALPPCTSADMEAPCRLPHPEPQVDDGPRNVDGSTQPPKENGAAKACCVVA